MTHMGDRYRKALIDRVLRGPGMASPELRRAAFDNHCVDDGARTLVDKAARCAWTIDDDDVEAVKRAGLSEDQIFEVVVCAAVGQAARQLDAAMVAVEAAAREQGEVS